jgi:hypothetical protein
MFEREKLSQVNGAAAEAGRLDRHMELTYPEELVANNEDEDVDKVGISTAEEMSLVQRHAEYRSAATMTTSTIAATSKVSFSIDSILGVDRDSSRTSCKMAQQASASEKQMPLLGSGCREAVSVAGCGNPVPVNAAFDLRLQRNQSAPMISASATERLSQMCKSINCFC